MKDIKFHKLPKKKQVEDFIHMKFTSKPYFNAVSYLEGILEFVELLKEVLLQIWDKIKDEVKKIDMIRLVSSSYACRTIYPHLPAKGEKYWPEIWFLIFPSSLAEPLSQGSAEWKGFVKYQICQQFCRFYLRKDELCKEDADVAANNLARLWGFTTIEAADPKESRTVWAMIHELQDSGERLDECLERLMEEGLVRKFKQAIKTENEAEAPEKR